ncbi:MAG: hypothetical protein Tsb0020_03980 [Haliangiales bacterium]
MNLLQPAEHDILAHILSHDGKLTDYQLSRYLLSRMDPGILQQSLVRIRELGLAELHPDANTARWRVTDKGRQELGQAKDT